MAWARSQTRYELGYLIQNFSVIILIISICFIAVSVNGVNNLRWPYYGMVTINAIKYSNDLLLFSAFLSKSWYIIVSKCKCPMKVVFENGFGL